MQDGVNIRNAMNSWRRNSWAIARILCAMACIGLLSAADAPWHESVIPLSGGVKELRLRVRQMHPFLAEFEYEVSGKLPDGKTFTQRLSKQCGGQALLTIDEIPGRGDADGYIRFHLLDAQEGITADFLDLRTGLLAKKVTDVSRARPLRYIEADLKFYKASAWALDHAQAKLALYSKDFKKSLELGRKELADARSAKNKDAVASALYVIALSEQLGNLSSAEEIERNYNEAIQTASEQTSDPRVETKWGVLNGFAIAAQRFDSACRGLQWQG